jgi:hypothetical protein
MAAIFKDGDELVFTDLPNYATRAAEDEGAGRDNLSFGYQGMSTNDAAASDVAAVEESRTHANEDLILDGAAVEGHSVANGDIGAD